MRLAPPLYIRWILKRWALPCLNITIAMLVLFSFFDALSQWDTHQHWFNSLKWIIRRIPYNLYEMLPFSVLLASMVTASNWAQHGEWTIIRFAGWTWRHNLIGILVWGGLLGSIGLFADSINARWLNTIGTSTKVVWIQNAGHIFKIGEVNVTGLKTAELKSIYIYPDSTSVEHGAAPTVYFVPQASLNHNTIHFVPPAESSLPNQLPMPFYLILEPNTLEHLDLPFLINTLQGTGFNTTSANPTERILTFTLAKKSAYPLWMMYWIIWGSLLLNIPPRFRHARTYQAGLFATGALLIFGHRTLSTVLMQQGFSGWWMNGVMLLAGSIGLFVLRGLLRWKTAKG